MSDKYSCEYCGEEFSTPAEKGGHVNAHIRRIDDEELLSEIRRIANQNGRAPSKAEMNELGKYSARSVQNRFGSWTNGIREAGLEPTWNTNITEEELINDIRKVSRTVGSTPTVLDFEDHGEYSRQVARSKFGGWNSALQAAGFEPNNRYEIPAEDLIQEIQRLADQLNRPPFQRDMIDSGKYSLGPFYTEFGSWCEAIQHAGYQPIRKLSGPDHPNWVEEPERIRYGPNWPQQRENAIERDEFVCQSPGCNVSREDHFKKYNRDLNVHHLIPVKVFAEGMSIDYEKANDLENLVTLCVKHHRKWEQISPLKPDIRDF